MLPAGELTASLSHHGTFECQADAEGGLFLMSDYPFLNPRLRTADSLPIHKTSPDLLDLDKVEAHIARAVKLGRYPSAIEPMEYLLLKQCVVSVEDEQYATLAGILCFGRDPQAIFSSAVVDIGHYRGEEPISFEVINIEKNIGGTIFDQLNRVEEYLKRNTHTGMILSDHGFERIEVPDYPIAVIRELGVNMLAHRDYTLVGSTARVLLFRDRIEWISPGGLLPGVTITDILDAQNSRNPVIQSILYEAGYVEALGQGLDTVVKVLREEKMRAPVFKDIVSAFMVKVFGREHKDLERFDYVPLSDIQKRIVNLVRERGEISLDELDKALHDRAKRTIQADLDRLIEANIVERVGQTRATRYHLKKATRSRLGVAPASDSDN
jgi:ATP-dependent DNA helicase RecG